MFQWLEFWLFVWFSLFHLTAGNSSFHIYEVVCAGYING